MNRAKVEREPGSKSCRIAPWDCLRDAFSSVIGYYKLCGNWGKLFHQNSTTVQLKGNSTQLRPSLTRATPKWSIKVLDYNALRSVYRGIRSFPRMTGENFGKGGGECFNAGLCSLDSGIVSLIMAIHHFHRDQR